MMELLRNKEQTDYKSLERRFNINKKVTFKATVMIVSDISVMEGYQDPGFTLARCTR